MSRRADGADEDVDAADSRSYAGLLSAIPYAIRTSESWTFRLYAVVATLLSALVTVVFALALVTLLVETAAARGGFVTLSRTFFVVVGLGVVFPLLAPVLLVARRHRRNRRVSRFYDTLLGLAGFGFVAGVYLALLVSAPPAYREPTANPVVAALYALPPLAGLAIVVAAAALVALAHWWGTRPARRA